MYLRLSPYGEVLQGVLTSLQINEGIIKVTGASGAGKTALCNQLCQELQADSQAVVFLREAPGSAMELQQRILATLGLDASGNFTRTLSSFLLARGGDAQPLVLIVDDAQKLDPQTFSAIRMLCNIQDQARSLVRVVLCGSEELDARLGKPALRAVTQFVNQSFTLPWLTQEQVRDFCQAWWLQAGADMKPLDDKTLEKLFAETKGQPGLLQARLKQGTTGAEPADRYHEDAPPSPAPPYRYRGRRAGWIPALAITAGLAAVGGATWWWLFAEEDARAPVNVVSNPVPLPEPDVPPSSAIEATNAIVADEEPVSDTDSDIDINIDTDAAEEAVIAAVADEPAEVAATTPAPPSVEDFVAAWIASWQSRDLDAYLAHYHANFAPLQGTRAEWEQQRRRVIGNAGDIEIKVEDYETVREAQDGMRIVRFWLDYRAANYADRTLKELILAPVDGTWRIRAESSLRTERL